MADAAAGGSAGRVLFAGKLLSGREHVQIQPDAVAFLQQLAEPVIVVSVHGAKGSGKTSSIRQWIASECGEDDRIPQGPTDGVWLYVARTSYSKVKYILYLDCAGFGDDREGDTLLYSLLSALSSVVVHHVRGELEPAAIGAFTFLANVDGEDVRPNFNKAFPQSPKLMWLLQDVTTGDLKERVGEKKISAQDVEQIYFQQVIAEQTPYSENAILCEQFLSVFRDQSCFAMPNANSPAYPKRLDKLSRFFAESERNRYMKGVQLNGPLFCSILVSMLAHKSDIFQAFHGKIWKETIHNCCLNIVELGIKLYKSRMAEQLGGLVDITDLEDYTPFFMSSKGPSLPMVELPCERDILLQVHSEAKRIAKMNLKTMPVRKGKLSALLKKLFKDLINSLFLSVQEENDQLSSLMCQTLLMGLHKEMTEKVEKLLLSNADDDEDSYAYQSPGHKRFFHQYQAYLYDLIGEYTEKAKGPVRTEELSLFCRTVIRSQLAELSKKLEDTQQRDVDTIEASIEESEKTCEESNESQRRYQKEAMNAQTEVNKSLVEIAKLQALRKEVLEGAIENLDMMHQMATDQKDLLEEAAFVSVQLPCEKVIEAAQETEVTQLQGYLIKQGGGGNAFNPLGRRNWKQRYFILSGPNLIYAKTKDDYERGRIIKELCLTGCKVETSRDAGEGFNIIPPNDGRTPHVFGLQKGLFEKNSKKKSSYADSGRIFKLRAQTIDERNMWVDKLRECAGGGGGGGYY